MAVAEALQADDRNEEPGKLRKWKQRACRLLKISEPAERPALDPERAIEGPEPVAAGEPDVKASKNEAEFDKIREKLDRKIATLGAQPACRDKASALNNVLERATEQREGDDAEAALRTIKDLYSLAKDYIKEHESGLEKDYKDLRGRVDKRITKVFKKKQNRKTAPRDRIVELWKVSDKTVKRPSLDLGFGRIPDYPAGVALLEELDDLLKPYLGEEPEGREEPVAAPQGEASQEDFLQSAVAVKTAEVEQLFESLFAPPAQAQDAISPLQRDLHQDMANSAKAQEAQALKQQIENADPNDPQGLVQLLEQLDNKLTELRDENCQRVRASADEDRDTVATAFEQIGVDQYFDTFLDTRNFDPNAKGEGAPLPSEQLIAVQEAVARVSARADALKANGGSLDDLVAVWDAVPAQFRPDEVIEELRPYFLAQKAIKDESAESRAESVARFKHKGIAACIDGLGAVAGGFSSILGDNAYEKATGGFESGVENAAERLSGLEEAAGVDLNATEAEGFSEDAHDNIENNDVQEWFEEREEGFKAWAHACTTLQSLTVTTTMGMEKFNKNAALGDPVERNNPEALLQAKRAKSVRLKAANHLETGRKLVSQVIQHAKLAIADPMIGGLLTMAQGFLQLIKAFEQALKALEATERELAILTTQARTDRTGAVNQSAEAMRAALTQQKVRADRNRKAFTAVGAGRLLRGGGQTLAGATKGEPVTGAIGVTAMVAGVGIEGTGRVLQARAELKNYKTNKAEEKNCKALLQQAAAGDPEAKQQLMRDSSFYAAMYLAIAAKEHDPEALRVLGDMDFDEQEIEENNAYILRKAMLWAADKDDRPSDRPGMVGLAKRGAKKAGNAVVDAHIEVNDIISRRNRTHDRIVVEEYPAQFTLQNWKDTKAAAYADGVKEKSTGIQKRLEAYEKRIGKLRKKKGGLDGEKAQECLDLIDSIFHRFGKMKPEWISPRPDGVAPTGFAQYTQDMRDLAQAERRDLLNLCSVFAEDDGPPPFFVMADLNANSFTQSCKDAAAAGVVFNSSVKDASKALKALEKAKAALDADETSETVRAAITAAEEVQLAMSGLAPQNKNFPGIDSAFLRYSQDMAKLAMEEILRCDEIAETKRQAFTVSARELSFESIIDHHKQARDDCWLEEQMPGETTTALRDACDNRVAANEAMSDEELAGHAGLATYWDDRALKLMAFGRALRSYRKACLDHKPWRDYLLDICKLADQEAVEADRKKQICLGAAEGESAATSGRIGPKTLTLTDWSYAAAETQTRGLEIYRSSNITQAFKNYEKAPDLPDPEDREDDRKRTRKIIDKRLKALHSLDVLLPKAREKSEDSAVAAYLSGLCRAVTDEQMELEQLRSDLG